MMEYWVLKTGKVVFLFLSFTLFRTTSPITPILHYSNTPIVPARHLPTMLRNARRAGRSRLPARAFQWQAGSGEAGGSKAN